MSDAQGATTNAYNHYGLLTSVQNSSGTVRSLMYDPLDNPTNLVDANGLTIAQTFDHLGRLVSRAYAGGGTEEFTYSTEGLVAYTDPLQETDRGRPEQFIGPQSVGDFFNVTE